MENTEKVYRVMLSAEQPLKTGEVAELSGIDKKETENIIKKLTAEGKVFSPKRCYWKAK